MFEGRDPLSWEFWGALARLQEEVGYGAGEVLGEKTHVCGVGEADSRCHVVTSPLPRGTRQPCVICLGWASPSAESRFERQRLGHQARSRDHRTFNVSLGFIHLQSPPLSLATSHLLSSWLQAKAAPPNEGAMRFREVPPARTRRASEAACWDVRALGASCTVAPRTDSVVWCGVWDRT